MKKCPGCKKDNKKFYCNKARKDGLDVYCIDCCKKKAKGKMNKKIQRRLQEQFIENEIWKDVSQFKGYQVSTEGRIRNKKTKMLLKPSKCCSGYAVSSIRGKNIKFHRIVAQTFLPNFNNKPTIEHKDDNKMNNKLYNLKWATYIEQQKFIKEKKSRKSQKGVLIGTGNMENLEGEIWKVVAKFPEYQISNKGRVKYPIRKGKKPYKKRITFGGSSSDGYKTFQFRNEHNNIKAGIHRIVAQEFITNPNKFKIVNHKDGNKQNNCVENLEWCTRSQNTQHAYNNSLISGKRKIYQLDVNNNIIKEWGTIKEAHQNLKLSRTAINNVLSGKNKTSGGYFWCYKENYNIDIKRHTLYDTNKKSIKQIDINSGKNIKIWKSLSEASSYLSKKNNSSIKAIKSNISQCIRGKRRSCQGFKWEYLK